MSQILDTLVIGAGQAGLAAGYFLRRAGLSFALLEAETASTGSWSQYYKSLALFSPVRYSSLPGLPFPGDPEHYPLRDEVIAYLASYANHFQFPVHFNQSVERVEWTGSHFLVHTRAGTSYEARSIIAATGSFHRPYLPTFSGQEIFSGQILHSAAYYSPEPFRGKRVVVVGAGNSAVQIATELAHVAQVTLSSRTPVRFRPQRIFGRDIHFWAWLFGIDRFPVGNRGKGPERTPVLDTGVYQSAIATGQPDWRPLFAKFTRDGLFWNDGGTEAVESVIFATGYRPNLDYLAPLGALDADGQVVQQSGRSLTVPGLYYVGLSLQRNIASATLRGVGPDAAIVVRHLSRHLKPGYQQSQEEGPQRELVDIRN